MDKTIITVNAVNLLTITIMVILGFSIVSGIGAAIVKAKAKVNA